MYDGVNWNFSYYNKKFNEDNCYKCDFVETDLQHVKLEENKLETAFFPLENNVSELLGVECE